MEQWYELISASFGPPRDERPAIADRSPSTKSQAAPASVQSSAAQAPSKIPRRAAPANQTIASVQTIQSPRGVVAERTVAPELCFATSVKVKYEPRDAWDDPHPFEAFLASPQFALQPWPQRAVPLDEAIARVAEHSQKGKKKPPTRK
jgi:hypothetical protein